MPCTQRFVIRNVFNRETSLAAGSRKPIVKQAGDDTHIHTHIYLHARVYKVFVLLVLPANHHVYAQIAGIGIPIDRSQFRTESFTNALQLLKRQIAYNNLFYLPVRCKQIAGICAVLVGGKHGIACKAPHPSE